MNNEDKIKIDDVLSLLNSDYIRGELIGSEITNIRFESIENRKSLIKIIIRTDKPRLPIVDIKTIFKKANYIPYFKDNKEFDLSTIELNVNVNGLNKNIGE